MFTPQRSREYNRPVLKTPEASKMKAGFAATPTSSPLHAFSPVVDALRNVRNNATREFDRLYGNFLTGSPKSSELEDENNRMEKLQNNLRDIQKQASYLASSAGPSTFAVKDGREPTISKRPHLPSSSPRYSPIHKTRPQRSFYSPNPALSGELSRHEFSILSADTVQSPIPSDIPTPPPLPPVGPKQHHLTRSNISPERSKNTPKCPSVSTPTPTRLMRDVLDDIPKAKLRSTAVISTPNGSQVVNRFWKEIHESTARRRQSTALTPSRQSGNSPLPSQKSNWAVDDSFWESPNTRSSSFNDKLRRVVEAEKEQQHKHKEHRPKTLEDEIQLANHKAFQTELEDRRRNVANFSFSLQPIQSDECLTDSTLSSPKNKTRRIDGDEWMFGGQEYILKERHESQ
ncbi:hypothetical protein DFQ29_006669 [Apophysomyces sp. BC1021]|nr:hypothetical protein DFQ29_006669 [Apophysomyces sp. BC1021]